MKKNQKIIIVSAAIILMIGSFFIGRMTMANRQRNNFGVMNQRFNQSGQRVDRNKQAMVAGKIEKLDGQQLVVKMVDGSTKIVMLSDNTAIKKMASSSLAALVVGQNVAVRGAQNSGVTMAESIEISDNQGWR